MSLSNISNICFNQLSTPTEQTPIDRRLFTSPYNNSIGDSRFINPITKDYSFNSSGKIQGMTGVQQQVYLSLTTILGSSASVNLGETYSQIQIMTQATYRNINNTITSALAPLLTANLIRLNGVTLINSNSTTGIIINVDWTDLTLTASQLASQNYGKNPVTVIPANYGCALSTGISPLDISSVEASFRADRGVVAQYGIVSAWWNEAAYEEAGGPLFDINRNANQSTIANQPTFNGSDFNLNNNPSITFGATQYLQTGSWIDGYVAVPVTVFIVGYWKDNAATYNAFDGYGGTNYTFKNVSGTLKIYETADAVGLTATLTPNVYIVVFESSNSYYKQSSNVKTLFTGSPGNVTALGVTLGNSLAGSNGGFTMAEFALFNGELSQYDQDGLLQYAKNRYGIAIS